MYVKVRRSEVKELETTIDDALKIMKELHAKNESLEKQNEMLENENKFLRGLVEKLTAPTRTYPSTFKVPVPVYNPWEQPYGPVKDPYTLSAKCDVCGLQGITGYVCNRTDCPTKVSCTT